MPEEKKPPRRSDKRKKKKKKIKKATASATTENTEKPQPVSLPPDTLPVPLLPLHSPGQPQGKLPKLRAASKKDGDRLSGTGQRSRKPPKDSLALLTLANPTGGSTAPVRGRVAGSSAQVRESLRWEGVLEDPEAEETRLELYRANRRQRYIAHRENQVKGAQGALRLTNLNGCKGKKAWAGSEQQAAASLLHMCTD